MPEGRQSPSPSRQTGAQQGDPPASGQGLGAATATENNPQDQLKDLQSNPKGVTDDEVKAKFTKEAK